MKLEIVVSYSRGAGYVYKRDEECCVPAHDITDEEAKKYMELLPLIGCRRHETKTQIFYDKHVDSNHVEEYIFWK